VRWKTLFFLPKKIFYEMSVAISYGGGNDESTEIRGQTILLAMTLIRCKWGDCRKLLQDVKESYFVKDYGES
jgi:hypothetical protein